MIFSRSQMMKYIYRTLLIFAAAVSSITAQPAVNSSVILDKHIYGHEYSPSNDKMRLIFDSNFGQTTTRVELLKDAYKVINESEDFIYSQTFTRSEEGIYLLRTEQHVDIFLFLSSSADISYNVPALQLPMPLTEGQEWNWNGYQIDDGDTTSMNIYGKVIGEENITLPAGNFDALKIQLKINTGTGARSVVDQWLAPNLGVIKMHAQIEDDGLIGLAMDLFGFDELFFDLKEVKY